MMAECITSSSPTRTETLRRSVALDEFPSCVPASSAPFPVFTLGSPVLQDDIRLVDDNDDSAFISVVKLSSLGSVFFFFFLNEAKKLS